MAKSGDGFLGKLSGKVGNIVISSWKGIPYIRSRPSGNPSNTPAQKKQRSKFGLVIRFVNSIRPVINAGFKHNTDRMTELNSATSYLMKRAIVTKDGQARLHYPSVLISRGDLAAPEEATADRVEDGIRFSWTHDRAQPGTKGSDNLIVVAYEPEREQPQYYAGDDVFRKDESYTLPLTDMGDHNQYELYLGFCAADGSDACDSVYLGQMELAVQ